MRLTFNKQTALALLRLTRRARGSRGLALRPCRLLDPDPAPGRRWTTKLLEQSLARAGLRTAPDGLLHISVSNAGKRPKHKFFACTVYSTGLPDGAFLQLMPDIAISSPELLFLELANDLSPAEHLLLGFELTGEYALDPYAAKGGKAELKTPAVTSVERIGAFLDSCRHVNGTEAARRTLGLLADGARSPFESIVATMMSLPWEEYGYGFGRCELNRRVRTPEHLEGSAQKESRVPDILIAGTHVGVNYDGGDHMPLGDIADADIALGHEPGSGHIARELDGALAQVRAKYVDDGRRNRELSASGYVVYPVYKEDLYEFGGLDRTMMQVMEALRQRDKWDTSEYQRILQLEFARKERQALLQSLMPGRDLKLEGDVEEAFVRLPRLRHSR